MASIRRVFLSAVFVLFLPSFLPANPFLGTVDESVPAPPRAVLGGGAGPFADLQFEFREKAAALLAELKENPSGPLLAGFLLAAFVYGVLHGAGPGHRKTVVFSLFLARKAKLWEPLAAGFFSSGLHAATALGIIAFYSLAERGTASLADTDRAGIYLEGATFLALVAFAVFLLGKKLSDLIRNDDPSRGNETGKGVFSMIALASLIPCPGAAMIMLFSLYVGTPLLGALGVLAMSFGMGIVVSSAGYLAMAGRKGLFSRLLRNGRRLHLAADLLEAGSYLFILAFSLFMAWPFLLSLIERS